MLNKLVYLRGVASTATSGSPFAHHYPLHFSLRFCTTTSNSPSFAVSYLIYNFGFSPESASRTSTSYNISFQSPEKPESVISFFRNRGFSKPQINNMVRKHPWLLSCDPCKRILPKFDFFLSKGVSSSKIVELVSTYPEVLAPSLKNHIVPTYELVYRFLQSDVNTIASMCGNLFFTSGYRPARNVRVLQENGVRESNIARLLRYRSKAVFSSTDIVKFVEKLKGLGFDPSKSAFAIALIAVTSLSRSRWKEKVNAFKKWGWSDEAVLEAFRRYPSCMLTSIEKINIVMNFWVNQLGWDALNLVQCPRILGSSMEKTIIPRGLVVQYLLAKGLRKKSASRFSPFIFCEKVFLEKYVIFFKEETCQLLKLYQQKNYVQGKEEDSGACGLVQALEKWIGVHVGVVKRKDQDQQQKYERFYSRKNKSRLGFSGLGGDILSGLGSDTMRNTFLDTCPKLKLRRYRSCHDMPGKYSAIEVETKSVFPHAERISTCCPGRIGGGCRQQGSH
ncbi:unnamed protein product [Sphenostylis stenocarpa]|uniref:Mitochondrial transcription termination factor n=1 Tax=Sphenostylis stenocarpa TaxID=92480 RepID=A0AA86SNZ9_9FABA|nr:unnamed protein product [Sphenostylis stenocarpa]